MVTATIQRNLQLFSEKAFVSVRPAGKWEYRIGKYKEQNSYEMLTDWAEYNSGVTFNTQNTFFARLTFVPTVPKDGQFAFLNIITASLCEAIVKINGVNYGGINMNLGRTRINLPEECYGKETLVELEVFASNHAKGDWDTRPLDSCSWIIEDKLIYDFQESMNLLWDVYTFTKNQYKKDKLYNLIVHLINSCDQSLEGEEYKENIAELNRLLKEGIKEIGCSDDMGNIDLIASTHIDTAWLWQYKDTIRKASRSALIQLRLMEKYPEYTFGFSQPSVYNYIKESYPDVYEQIKQKVADGQWLLLGPMWVEGDLNISGGEALVREFLYGHQFFKKEFGKTSDVCWIPDSFGFPASLPQIFRKCGTNCFFTTKVRWQAAIQFPYNVFVWEGIDGTKITSSIPDLKAFYNGNIKVEQLVYAGEKIEQKGLHDRVLMPYGFGDGGGGPTEFMLDNYRKLKEYPGMPKLNLTTVPQYYAELEKKADKLPVWKGEVCVETHQGTYTTIAKNKRFNRYGENALRRLDLLTCMAGLDVNSDSYKEIVKNWKDLLLMQFHDVLPGSSINAVYEDTDKMYAELFDFTGKMQNDLICDVFAPEKDENCITVFNPNSFTSSAYVNVDAKFEGYAFTDGKNISNVIPDGKGGFMFKAEKIAGFEAKVFTKTAKVSAEKSITLTEEAGLIKAETPFFTFDIHADGTLHNFYDKVEKVTYSKDTGLNTVKVYRDGPEREDAWNIDRDFKLRPVDMKWENSAEIIENNGERAIVRITKKGQKTTVTQDIVIYSDIARVDFNCHINWNEKYRLMQVTFPTTINTPYASYEIAYGICKRMTHPNTPGDIWKHEFAGHRFVDLSDDKRGAAVINDCKYGHNAIDGEITMTLFRNTEFPSKFIDAGEHDYSYSFLPHSGGIYGGNVAKEAYLFNSSLVAFEGKAEKSAFLSLSDDSLFIDCVKPAEDGNGYIVRMYEPYGTSGCTSLSLEKEAVITEVSPIEDAIGDSFTAKEFDISFTPFEIKTFRIAK